MNEPAKQPLELPAATYEPQLSCIHCLERYLSREVLLHVFDLSGTFEVKTCYGDVVKIVNALRDYAKLLELVCDEWELAGFHRQPMNIRRKAPPDRGQASMRHRL